MLNYREIQIGDIVTDKDGNEGTVVGQDIYHDYRVIVQFEYEVRSCRKYRLTVITPAKKNKFDIPRNSEPLKNWTYGDLRWYVLILFVGGLIIGSECLYLFGIK